jgi:hypothetical protein
LLRNQEIAHTHTHTHTASINSATRPSCIRSSI